MKQKVLLQTANYPGVGGIERSFEILSERLKKNGYDVKIIAAKNDTNEKIEDVITYETKKYKFLKLSPVINFLAYRSFIKKNRNFLDECILVSRLLPISFALHFMGIKHIFIPPAVSKDFYEGVIKNINDKNYIKRLLKKTLSILSLKVAMFFEKQVLKDKSIKIFTFSENVKNNLLVKNNISREIKVIPPGIDTNSFFSLEQDEINTLRISLNIKRDDFVILYVGRTSHGKNVHFLIDAVNNLPIVNKKLLIVGDGDFEISNSPSVIAVGKKNLQELYKFYNIANCLVLPTTHEGFGQVLIESLGCGTPVIGFETPYTAIKEIITDKTFGIKTKNISKKGLETVILELYHNKKYYQLNRKLIDIKIKERFDWDNLLKAIINE